MTKADKVSILESLAARVPEHSTWEKWLGAWRSASRSLTELSRFATQSRVGRVTDAPLREHPSPRMP